ncbi:hypothetical protein [Alkalicoccus luteus]|uniref:IS3 family transposase n=1 Tax=Alkalicoccus luteus TaxID=1237094 RepID=A0A969TVG1_9BACI|nr:hypothetical protein [Alkalicoccus luteus]NJP38365.1 hypothetical protein [Alkalicoccus luteus]
MKEGSIVKNRRCDSPSCPGILYEKPRVIFAHIRSLEETYSVEQMCEVLGVSKSGYYKWKARQSDQA